MTIFQTRSQVDVEEVGFDRCSERGLGLQRCFQNTGDSFNTGELETMK